MTVPDAIEQWTDHHGLSFALLDSFEAACATRKADVRLSTWMPPDILISVETTRRWKLILPFLKELGIHDILCDKGTRWRQQRRLTYSGRVDHQYVTNHLVLKYTVLIKSAASP
jgi:hypothetical protein